MFSVEDLMDMIATEAHEGPFCEGACFGYHKYEDSREFKHKQQLKERGLNEPAPEKEVKTNAYR
jgi:hypothetical protein